MMGPGMMGLQQLPSGGTMGPGMMGMMNPNMTGNQNFTGMMNSMIMGVLLKQLSILPWYPTPLFILKSSSLHLAAL